jgi:two-component system, response regulator YesN
MFGIHGTIRTVGTRDEDLSPSRLSKTRKSFPLHWSLFARTFALYFLITSVSVGIVAFLAVKVSNDHILDEVSVASAYALESKRSVVEERLQKVDSIAFQTMYNPSTFRLVWSESSGSTALLLMRDLINDFRTVVLAQGWLHSIYFFTSRADYVLSTTKYSKEEFPDQEVLRLLPMAGLTVLGPRRLGNDNVITFVQAYGFFGNNVTGTVVVNAYYDRFFSELQPDREKPGFAVVSSDRALVFPAALPTPFPSLEAIMKSADGTAVLQAGPPSRRFLVVHDRSLYRPWTYLYFREYAEVVRPASLVRRVIVIALLGVLCVAVLTVWTATRRLQEPLAALVRWTRGVVGGTEQARGDEYELVQGALRSLLLDNVKLSESYKTIFPYFRRHSITELLHTRNWDVARFDSIVELLGFHLTRSRFHTAIFELRGADNGAAEQEIRGSAAALRRAIEDALGQAVPPLAAVAAEEDARRVALIINTDEEAASVLAAMERLRKDMGGLGFATVVSLSQSFRNLAELPDHFSETEVQIKHQAFFGTDKVIYDSYRAPRAEARIGLAPQIDCVVAAVRSHDPGGLQAALELFDRAISKAGESSIDDTRFAYFSLADTVQSLLPEYDFDRRQSVFQQAQEAASSQALCLMVSQQARKVMERLDAVRRHQHSDTVRRAAAWIEEHLGENISVDNVAEAVFLSSRYLNSLFHSERGQTVFEYISSVRIKRAEALLTDPKNLQVQEIAHALGYYNVQSFIRLFKRYHGVTPAEYRRSCTIPAGDP